MAVQQTYVPTPSNLPEARRPRISADEESPVAQLTVFAGRVRGAPARAGPGAPPRAGAAP
ncbi:hypothetical protein MUU72_02510 [Streptomyces sp. RS10V-4]|nr:hypothetical protein [Streptomyces rhizoryzae]